MQTQLWTSSSPSSVAKPMRAPMHVAREDLKPFWWVGLCELTSRPGLRGLVAVQTLGTDVLRYHVLSVAETPEELEPSWRDAVLYLCKEREDLPQPMLDESAALNVKEADILGAWGYGLERVEFREAGGPRESNGRPRHRVWTIVALRTEGKRVTRTGIPEEARTGTPYFDPDFHVAWAHYERLAIINLLSEWRSV